MLSISLLVACGTSTRQPQSDGTLSPQGTDSATASAISQAMQQPAQAGAPFVNAEAPPVPRATRFGLSTQAPPKVENVDWQPRLYNQKPNYTKPGRPTPVLEAPVEKISPVTREYISGATGEVILTLVLDDRISLEGFPKRDNNRDEREWQQKADAFIAEVRQRRQPYYQTLGQILHDRLGVQIIETFWISNTVVVKASKAAVPVLERIPEVRAILGGVVKNVYPTVLAGRNLSETDALDAAAPVPATGSGNIILIDSGVRTSHTLLQGKIASAADCTQINCPVGNPGDVAGTAGHGTSSAAVMVGNATMGNAYQGVSTRHLIDSLKTGVLCPSGSGTCTDYNATLRAIQKAASMPGNTVMADVQFCPNDSFGVSLAREANKLYDVGKVMLAANGNYGGSDYASYCRFTSQRSTVASPAMAHKVLGVGAVSVNAPGSTAPYQSQGPTLSQGAVNDWGRIKPDIQAPTDMTTANNSCDTCTWTYSGTSAATPFATATAALWRTLVGSNSATYATMLANGNVPATFYDYNLTGTGLINTRGISGNATLDLNGITRQLTATNEVAEYTVTTTKPSKWVRVALWWPEGYDQAHNDFDLEVVAPDGRTYVSNWGQSVWEFVTSNESFAAGTWKLRVRGYEVNVPYKPHYWAFYRGE